MGVLLASSNSSSSGLLRGVTPDLIPPIAGSSGHINGRPISQISLGNNKNMLHQMRLNGQYGHTMFPEGVYSPSSVASSMSPIYNNDITVRSNGTNGNDKELQSLLPAYRPAPDYKMAVQMKYGCGELCQSDMGETKQTVYGDNQPNDDNEVRFYCLLVEAICI